MAEKMTTESLQTTNSVSFCILCGGNIEHLVRLPCLHSMSVCESKECAEKNPGGEVQCPHCSESFQVPSEGFPQHSFAERKAVVRKIEENSMFCHAEHSTPQAAVAFCSDCPGSICEECYTAHTAVTVLKKHRIISLEDMLKAGLPGHLLHLTCPAHKEELKCFCLACDVLVCTACQVTGSHQSHSVLYVDEDMGQMARQPLQQCITSVKKRMDNLSYIVNDVDSCLVSIEKESSQCIEDISNLKLSLIKTLTSRCAALVEEVKKERDKKKHCLEEYKASLKSLLKMMELFKALSADVVSEGTTRELLSLRKAVIERAASLVSAPLPSSPVPSSFICLQSETEELKKTLLRMGHVSLGADPGASSIEGLSIEASTIECRPWSLPLRLTLVCRNSKGVKCDRGGDQVLSALTPNGCGVAVQGDVEDSEDGTYQIAFRCLPSEDCMLSVAINGRSVPDGDIGVKLEYPSMIKQEIKDCQGRGFDALHYSVEDKTLLATDKSNSKVCCFALSGELLYSFDIPYRGEIFPGIAVLSDSNIAISVFGRNCILVCQENGKQFTEFKSSGLKRTRGLACNSSGKLFVLDRDNYCVSVFTDKGEHVDKFGSKGSGPGQFNDPHQICIGHDELLYISDYYNNCVQVFQQNGSFVRQFGQGVLRGPKGVAHTRDGHIVVASWSANKLSFFTPNGECTHEVKGIGLYGPYGVAIADDGSIFVADRWNGRIVKL